MPFLSSNSIRIEFKHRAEKINCMLLSRRSFLDHLSHIRIPVSKCSGWSIALIQSWILFARGETNSGRCPIVCQQGHDQRHIARGAQSLKTPTRSRVTR